MNGAKHGELQEEFQSSVEGVHFVCKDTGHVSVLEWEVTGREKYTDTKAQGRLGAVSTDTGASGVGENVFGEAR